jgi:hypothetical protein
MTEEMFLPFKLTEHAPGLLTSGEPSCRGALKYLVSRGFRAFVFVTPIPKDWLNYLDLFRDDDKIPILKLQVKNVATGDKGFEPDEHSYKQFCEFLLKHWPEATAANHQVLVCCRLGIRSAIMTRLFLKNFPEAGQTPISAP